MQERIIYGMNTVAGMLRHSAAGVIRLCIDARMRGQRFERLHELYRQHNVAVDRVSEAELDALTGTDKHQGVAAVVTGPAVLDERAALAWLDGRECPLVLVLDGVEDPRNFGACLRTADAAGVDLVVTGRSRGVAITPVVSKVASGAAEVQPLARVANLARFLKALRQRNIWLVGADEGAADTVYTADLAGPVALVMGAEGRGLRRLTRECCDMLVRLPMQGVVESLNVAVATGICLYEARRQRAARGPGSA